MKIVFRGLKPKEPRDETAIQIVTGDRAELFDEDGKKIFTVHFEDGVLVVTMTAEAFLTPEVFRQFRDAAGG